MSVCPATLALLSLFPHRPETHALVTAESGLSLFLLLPPGYAVHPLYPVGIRNIICAAWYPFIMRCCSKYVSNLLCHQSDICTRLSSFGSIYITLTDQNSKTIRIIFLPKCTQKNCAFYAVFYMFFLRIFSHKLTFVGIPLFNSAKIRTKGVIGLYEERV